MVHLFWRCPWCLPGQRAQLSGKQREASHNQGSGKEVLQMVFCVSQQFDGIGSTLPPEGNTKGEATNQDFESLRLLSNCYHAMMLCGDCCFILDWVCFPRWIFQSWELGKSHCNQERRKPQRLWRKWWSNSDVVVSADLYYVNLLIWCFDQNVTRRTLWLILNSEHVIFLQGLPYCCFGQWYF